MTTHWSNYRFFKQGYGEFPYIIIKIGHALFMQIPIHFLKEDEDVNTKKHPGTQVRDVSPEVFKEPRKSQIFLLQDEILATTEFVLNKVKASRPNKKLEACLVLGKRQALYYNNGRFKPNTYIPTGGTLVDQGHNMIGMNVEHFLPYENSRTTQDLKRILRLTTT